MKNSRLKDAVLSAMGDRESVVLSEIMAAIYSTYSEAELLRRGVQRTGRKSKKQRAYMEGRAVTGEERAQLVSLGINKVIGEMKARKCGWIEIDTQAGVATRVRK